MKYCSSLYYNNEATTTATATITATPCTFIVINQLHYSLFTITVAVVVAIVVAVARRQ